MGEWRVYRLGEVAEIFDGPHATPQKTEDGPVFLGISCLDNGRLDLSSAEHLSEDDYVTWTRRIRPEVGDVVFSYETRLGEAATVPTGLKCCLGRRMGLLRARGDKVDSKFLLYAYLGKDFRQTIDERAIRGSTVDRIPLVTMAEFPIRLPVEASEQRAIASVLSAMDDKIALNRRMAATLEEMARALFKSWFVDFDPVRAKAEGRDTGLPSEIADLFPDRLVDSDLGELPAGWRTGSIYEIADVVYGAPFSSALFNTDGDGLPVIRIRDLKSESPGVWTTEIHPRGRLIRPGDLLVGMDGEFRCYLWSGQEAWLNQRVCCLVPRNEIGSAFVRYSVSPRLAEIEASEVGTTVIHLGKGDIDLFRVVVPPPAVERAFTSLAGPLFAKGVAARRGARALADLRDALLPKMVSGEIRIAEPEHFLARMEAVG